MKIVKTILKGIIGAYGVFSMALVSFAFLANATHWYTSSKCECGGQRVLWRGPMKFMNKL